MALRFKDINDWKPSSISIVDKPGHPMAVFEVYEDDDEFIKKYAPIEVGNLNNEEKTENETVTMSGSFFEKLFGSLISKSEPVNEPPAKPPVKEGEEEEEKEDKLDKIIERLDSFDERLKKLENPEEAPGAVAKSEGASTGDGGEGQGEGGESQTTTEGQEESGKEEVVDDKTMVKKSQEVDPDLNKGSSAPSESFMKRIGRSEDGMKW